MPRLPAAIGEPLWLTVARRELGTKEAPGKPSNPAVERYHAVTRGGSAPDDVPWCASFVSWCLEQVGIRSTRSKSASSYKTWGVGCAPEPGCVVVFGKSDPDAAGTGHVAFLVGVDGGDYLVIGGNQHNAVTVARKPSSGVVALRWPDSR